ncbi:MAG: SIMPL domain-containing protein [Clostridia bacterium]|nr:SIMPL domain-containing protein [Clostridia bacterium]
MKNQILKRAFALGCLTLALFCVVKKEEENKKPIIMQQMAVAEEIYERDAEEEIVLDVQDDDGEAEDEADYDEDAISGAEGDALQTDGEIIENATPENVVEYEVDDQLSILVVGSASTSVAPDSAVIYARIETLENDCNTSKENTLSIFDNVATALTDKGANKDNIKLECFNCSPCYEFSLTKSITGYCTTACISVELAALDALQEYIDVLTENGVCCIDNIAYKVSDMDSQYNIALSKALENAKIKAEKLSGQQGLTLVKIKEEMVHTPMLLKSSSNEVKLADYIGNVNIDAKVVAIFEK